MSKLNNRINCKIVKLKNYFNYILWKHVVQYVTLALSHLVIYIYKKNQQSGGVDKHIFI